MFPDLGIDLYVPATYADHAPKSHVLISSAVTAGSFVESMSNAIERYPSQRIALYYDLCVDIVIPSPSGERTTITRSKLVELIREYRPLSYYSTSSVRIILHIVIMQTVAILSCMTMREVW